jgi:CNT family concentrative nucleoside transporter
VDKLISLLGIFVILGIAYLMSNNRKKISLRVVVWGMVLPVFFAFIVLPNSPLNTFLKSAFHLSTAPGEAFFSAINNAVIKLLSFTADGSKFIFGNLISNNVPIGQGTAGSNMPVKQVAGYVASTGAYFAFSVLPTIIFFSAFLSVLYYLGIMQRVVAFVAWIMERCMRTSGAETLSASASIFLGQTEAPLVVDRKSVV